MSQIPSIASAMAGDKTAQELLRLAFHLARSLGLSPGALLESRLGKLAGKGAGGAPHPDLHHFSEIPADPSPGLLRRMAAHQLGGALDFLGARAAHPDRKRTGSYFTPMLVAEALLRRGLAQPTLRAQAEDALPLRVCDPACGGGAFLVEAAYQLLKIRDPGASEVSEAAKVVRGLYGVDLSPLSVFVTEAALWLFVGDDQASVGCAERFAVGDALLGAKVFGHVKERVALLKKEPAAMPVDFPDVFPDVFRHPSPGFDWVVGNPPWVAFQGRATQKITSERRAFYRAHFRAFAGYPTLHGLFVEQATRLASRGHITLLLPSSVSDLDGYRSTRRVLLEGHQLAEPLPEFGQDAFSGVVQPCFGLIAAPRVRDSESSPPAIVPERVWQLVERTHAASAASNSPVPEALTRLFELPKMPPETFRELGFQSNREVASRLFLRAEAPEPPFVVPLLEGKNVSEFSERAPRLFLHPDQELLASTRCRLKTAKIYEGVDVVVRQTAAFTIAARHAGLGFRNSLLGAFATEDVDADLLVGLLNSALYRALHVSRQRDARQAAFPQVKVGHLRKLPLPPSGSSLRMRIRDISQVATKTGGLDGELRAALDGAVFELFSVSTPGASEIRAFLLERAPAALRPSR